MLRTLTLSLAAVTLALPPTALAQPRPAEFTYCANSRYLHDRYIGPNQGDDPNRVRPNGEGSYAKSRCMAGDMATGIPILERRLVDAKIELPTR